MTAMHSLPIFLRLQGRPVILLGDGPAAEAKRRLLERAGARVVVESAAAPFAIVAHEDEAAAMAAVARLKARGILVNAPDRPALCDFTIPAIVDRDPVMIAVGTGGASAGLAKTLRIAIEGMLPSTLGPLAQALQASRDRIRARWPDATERRQAIDDALAPGGVIDPLRVAEPADAIAQWLGSPAAAAARSATGITLSIGSVDPDDLTLRQARLLGQADHVFHIPDMPAAILDRARADARRVACADQPRQWPGGLSLWLRWSD